MSQPYQLSTLGAVSFNKFLLAGLSYMHIHTYMMHVCDSVCESEQVEHEGRRTLNTGARDIAWDRYHGASLTLNYIFWYICIY